MENEYNHDLLDLGNYPLPSCSALKGIFPAIEGAAVWALNKTQSRYDQAVSRKSNSKGRKDNRQQCLNKT